MMTMNHAELTTHTLSSTQRLDEMLSILDELHTAASEGNLQPYADLSRPELISLLQEVIFTAQETLREIKTTKAQKQPVLRLVK
jgi:uncharacterized protein YcaQ